MVEGLSLSDIKGREGIVFMGHGTDHEKDISYDKLEKAFREKGYENVYIATVEGRVTLEDIIPKLKDKGIQKVVLKPLMLVAGDHAINDMASDEGISWKIILEREGFNVKPILKGLGQLEKIQDIYLEHLEKIMD